MSRSSLCRSGDGLAQGEDVHGPQRPGLGGTDDATGGDEDLEQLAKLYGFKPAYTTSTYRSSDESAPVDTSHVVDIAATGGDDVVGGGAAVSNLTVQTPISP